MEQLKTKDKRSFVFNGGHHTVRILLSQYKAQARALLYNAGHMERLRPIGKHEKKMWDLRHKPWAYEYKMDLPAALPEMRAQEEPSIGLYLLALLASIIDLPVISEGAYDEAGKIEAPQSTLIAKS